MADDQQADFWYAETPDSNNLPAVVSMSIGNKYRWFMLKGIASKFNSRRQRWIIRESDEALRGPLHCGSAREVQRFFNYLVAEELLYVLEDGSRILTERAFPHVRDYPQHPDTEQSIRNMHVLAASGSAGYVACLGTPPPSARQALSRTWKVHRERLAAMDRPTPDEQADKRAYKDAYDAFASRFVPWYLAQLLDAGPSGRVNVQAYMDAEWHTAPVTLGDVTKDSVTSGECHTPENRDNSQSHSQTNTDVEKEDISIEMSPEIQKGTTDKQTEDITGRNKPECHTGLQTPCDIFFQDKAQDEPESGLNAVAVAAVDLLCKWGVKPRADAEDAVRQFGAERCSLYANAMTGFQREAKKRKKPIANPGGWLLRAIDLEYDLPAFVQSYVDHRQERIERKADPIQATAVAVAALPSADGKLLDDAFAALSRQAQCDIDLRYIETLPEKERKFAGPRIRKWIEGDRTGEIPAMYRASLLEHRRAVVLQQQGELDAAATPANDAP